MLAWVITDDEFGGDDYHGRICSHISEYWMEEILLRLSRPSFALLSTEIAVFTLSLPPSFLDSFSLSFCFSLSFSLTVPLLLCVAVSVSV